ncbi:tetratricopeptide repeat protein [Parasediminibacterium sp. JCM 36343]|uniref:tetratricopeptide repeat protein n=1 Tax=Parasediminibacterium sp. JCM 36343 TaxID=3374279 RepID=UPI0039791243
MNRCFVPLLVVFFIGCKNNTDQKNPPAANGTTTPTYVANLGKAVQQKPDSTGLRFNYVTALDSIGNYKQALAQLDSLIVRDKGNYALWYKKGQVCQHAGDTTSAIRYYTTAVNIYPAQDGLLALANLYAETKNPKTLVICQQIDELRLGREYDAYTAFFAGVFFARSGNKEKALFFFDKSIDNNYTFMDAYLEKGYVYFDSKKYNEALNVFSTAASVSNRFADAYYWQGKCYEALLKKTEAIAKYQQAFALDNAMVEAEAAIKRLQ